MNLLHKFNVTEMACINITCSYAHQVIVTVVIMPLLLLLVVVL